MTDMIKQIRPPTQSSDRRGDAFSPPKHRGKSKKKGKKKMKTAKETPREEGVNLTSDGKGLKARPSTAIPAAQKDGSAMGRRIKSANNNVNASSWVMSTEDENADENSDDEEHDLELDEARYVCMYCMYVICICMCISSTETCKRMCLCRLSDGCVGYEQGYFAPVAE